LRDLQVLDDFVQPFVERAISLTPEELKAKGEKRYSFIESLAADTSDRKMLRDQLVSTLLAGRDTTAAALSWTFYELSRHPEAYAKLRSEVLARLGTDQTPNWEDLRSMKWLQYTINEVLRLYPIVPFNVRTANKDTTLPRGGGKDGTEPVAISKNTAVAYSALCMQRRKDLFGYDVDEFRPERWERGFPPAWHYIPFNGGPRICLGQQFALTEMQYAVTRMVQRYDSIKDCNTKEQLYKADIVLTPGNGVWLSLHEA